MNTLLNHADVDTYLLYFLDIKTIINISILSKNQNLLLKNTKSINELLLILINNHTLDIPYIINCASAKNYINLLEWIHESINKFLYSEITINVAAKNAHIDILQFFHSNYKIYDIDRALKLAARYNHVKVLEWFHNPLARSLPLNYDNPSQKVALPFLPGFHKNEYEIKNISAIIEEACIFGNVDILEWFKKNNYDIKYFVCNIDIVPNKCCITILNWFKNNNYEIKYTCNTINNACKYGYIDILDWFHNSKYDLLYTEYAINFAYNINVIKWFDKFGYKLKYSSEAINYACYTGNLEIIEWFYNSAYEFKYDHYAIINAIRCNHTNVIKWFETNNFEFIVLDFNNCQIDWRNKTNYEQISKLCRYFNYDDQNLDQDNWFCYEDEYPNWVGAWSHKYNDNYLDYTIPDAW